MYAVKLVQVVSIVVVPEIYKLYIFLGAERVQSVVGAWKGFIVPPV